MLDDFLSDKACCSVVTQGLMFCKVCCAAAFRRYDLSLCRGIAGQALAKSPEEEALLSAQS